MRVPNVQFLYQEKDSKHQIFIYDEVKEFGKIDYSTWTEKKSETSAKYFQEVLEQIPEDGEIEIFINSNGGSVKEGIAIYNQLKRHGAKKTGYVDGVAHSIAFVILQACDHRVMGEGTSALIHEMWVATVGNARQLREEADQLDVLMEGSRKLFMQRAVGITEEELKSLMEAETMLTPDKALEYGFIDEIAGRKEEVTSIEDVTEDIKQLKEKAINPDFKTAVEEFVKSVEPKEKKQEASIMDAFFNAFL